VIESYHKSARLAIGEYKLPVIYSKSNNMEKTICVFGDSIAWGAWDPENGGWTSRFRRYCETNELDVEVYNLGVSGDNTYNLLERFDCESRARTPDMTLIAIGINDSQYINTKENPRVALSDFQANLSKLVAQASKYTNDIILISPTNVDESKVMPISWKPEKYYDNENIGIYTAKMKELCTGQNPRFIDLLNLLDNADLCDGLHPNAQGHEKIFLQINDYLLSNKLI